MSRLVPDGDAIFDHVAEGADDMPAHVRSVLTTNDLTVPITKRTVWIGDLARHLRVGNTVRVRTLAKC